MRTLVVLSVVLLTAVLSPAQAPQPTLSPFEQALLQAEKQFHEALAAKDSAYVNQIVSGDFRGIATNGDFYGRDELIGISREGLPKNYRAYGMVVMQLSDSAAVVTYNEIVPGSRPRYMHVSDTWVRQDGKWMLKFQQATPNLWSATDLD